MNNSIADALQQALNSKKATDYSSFIWKGGKMKVGDKFVQNSEKMEEMSDSRLKECYDHCEKMLYSEDPKHLGRYNVLDEITEQSNKCNVELLLRYYENTYLHSETRSDIKRKTLWFSLRQLLENNKEITDWTTVPITQVTSDLPSEFHDINISDVLDGCLDYLGSLDKQHLTMTFITKMGLWFNKAEESELKGINNSEKLRQAKERLHLPEKLVLKFSDKGLSFHEMRAMLILPKKQKYADMTNEQLVTLRNKVLPRLQRQIDGHIFSWERLQRQLSLIAKTRGIDLND